MEKTSARWWDLPSAILLFFLVLFSAWRLQVTDWTEGLNFVRNIAILSLMVGLALGQSKFQKRTIIVLALAYMLVFFVWQWLSFINEKGEDIYLGEQLLILLGRVFANIRELFAGNAIEDQFLVMALLCFPYWMINLYSGFQLTRHANVLASILPVGALMFVIHYYHYTTKDYSWMFGVFLFVALLLLGRQKYVVDKIKWAKERVLFSNESSVDINNTSITIAAAVVLLVWFIPYTLPATAGTKEAWRKITGDWFSGERWENLFSSINKEKKPQARNFQTEMGLGTQTSLSEFVVFLVYAPNSAQEYPRLYWRGQVYDTYEDNRWYITNTDELRQPSSKSINIPDAENRKRLTFAFDVFTETQIILFSASQPVSVNHNTIVLHNEIASEDEMLDVMTLRASPPLEAGDVIRITAMMANPTIPELQNAGTNYPTWVKETYLQLPNDFSPRIRDLALELSAEADSTYDKVTAITNYLRKEIKYSPAISIPDDVDPLEYFLFKKKQGFCNYYATTEVLMLRSIGIPARLAVGYAQGQPNIQNSIYTVREKDLHAWPEVYFPEYGWIEFEPTGNQDALSRPLEREEETSTLPIPLNPARQIPLGEEDQATTLNEANQEDEVANPLVNQSRRVWMLSLSGFLLLSIATFFIKRRYAPNQSLASILKNAFERRKLKLPLWLSGFLLWVSLPSMEKNYHVINLSIRWMRIPHAVHATAHERATLLQKKLPLAKDSIEVLLHEHETAMFSQRSGDEKLASRAAWNILRNALTARLKIFFMGYN